MAERIIVAEELAKLFSALSHPDRVRIIEELSSGEKDVQGLSEALEISSSRMSQHLSLLRTMRLVQERRDGKHHLYRLVAPDVATWILQGLKFTALELVESKSFGQAVKRALRAWGTTHE